MERKKEWRVSDVMKTSSLSKAENFALPSASNKRPISEDHLLLFVTMQRQEGMYDGRRHVVSSSVVN